MGDIWRAVNASSAVWVIRRRWVMRLGSACAVTLIAVSASSCGSSSEKVGSVAGGSTSEGAIDASSTSTALDSIQVDQDLISACDSILTLEQLQKADVPDVDRCASAVVLRGLSVSGKTQVARRSAQRSTAELNEWLARAGQSPVLPEVAGDTELTVTELQATTVDFQVPRGPEDGKPVADRAIIAYRADHTGSDFVQIIFNSNDDINRFVDGLFANP